MAPFTPLVPIAEGGAMPNAPKRTLRKRRALLSEQRVECRADAGLQELLVRVQAARNIVVFSGSGLSASSGMSMFTTSGGLYERACKRMGLPAREGIKLFSWPYYDKYKDEVTAFFVDIHKEASKAKPGPAHKSVAGLYDCGRLLRHYTMNVDGLALRSRQMKAWHPEVEPDGHVVELHGNIFELVCPSCHRVQRAVSADLASMRRCEPRHCMACNSQLRFRIMLYEDAEGEAVTSEEVWDRFEADMQTVDLIIWVGISFKQSASVEYFKKARRFIAEAGRVGTVTHAVINPADVVEDHLLTACHNVEELVVLDVRAEADAALNAVLDAARGVPVPSTSLRPRVADEADQSEESVALLRGGCEGVDTSRGSEGMEDAALVGTGLKDRGSGRSATPVVTPLLPWGSKSLRRALRRQRPRKDCRCLCVTTPEPGVYSDPELSPGVLATEKEGAAVAADSAAHLQPQLPPSAASAWDAPPGDPAFGSLQQRWGPLSATSLSAHCNDDFPDWPSMPLAAAGHDAPAHDHPSSAGGLTGAPQSGPALASSLDASIVESSVHTDVLANLCANSTVVPLLQTPSGAGMVQQLCQQPATAVAASGVPALGSSDAHGGSDLIASASVAGGATRGIPSSAAGRVGPAHQQPVSAHSGSLPSAVATVHTDWLTGGRTSAAGSDAISPRQDLGAVEHCNVVGAAGGDGVLPPQLYGVQRQSNPVPFEQIRQAKELLQRYNQLQQRGQERAEQQAAVGALHAHHRRVRQSGAQLASQAMPGVAEAVEAGCGDGHLCHLQLPPQLASSRSLMSATGREGVDCKTYHHTAPAVVGAAACASQGHVVPPHSAHLLRQLQTRSELWPLGVASVQSAQEGLAAAALHKLLLESGSWQQEQRHPSQGFPDPRPDAWHALPPWGHRLSAATAHSPEVAPQDGSKTQPYVLKDAALWSVGSESWRPGAPAAPALSAGVLEAYLRQVLGPQARGSSSDAATGPSLTAPAMCPPDLPQGSLPWANAGHPDVTLEQLLRRLSGEPIVPNQLSAADAHTLRCLAEMTGTSSGGVHAQQGASSRRGGDGGPNGTKAFAG